MSVTYKFPHDSPIRYLPLVYMLPYDLLVRCPSASCPVAWGR